jgi:hypothetical protein
MWPFDIELPNDTAICSQCGNTYGIHGWHTCWPIDKAVKEAIAARDKWWIEKIEDNCTYSKEPGEFNVDVDIMEITLQDWQRIKKEITHE